MKDSYRNGIVTLNEEIAKDIYKLKLKGDFKGSPGQFYMVRGWKSNDPFLARPISISDRKDGEITFLYQVVGRGTDIVSTLEAGDSLSVLGPLGKGFDGLKGEKIALVAGGIGIAPLLYLAKELKVDIDLYAGFRDQVYYLEEFEDFTRTIKVSTETGSQGHKGFITEILKPEAYDLVVSCGPEPMMEGLINLCKDRAKVVVSMENRMACGIGACTGCNIETIRGMERVCKEGPVFKGEEVIFNG